MYADFHYGVVKVLARAAGFAEEDAQVVAYASQYTDNAANHMPVRVEGVDGLGLDERLAAWMALMEFEAPPDRALIKPQVEGPTFDPVCTAHESLDYLLGLSGEVQRDVYVPFHFVPQRPAGPGGKFNWRTRVAAPLPRSLLDAVLGGVQADADGDGVLRGVALCALGIALHAWADSWAHEGFSGRFSHEDNNIEIMEIDGVEPPAGITRRLGDRIPIGHLEADGYPDRPHVRLRFVFERGDTIERYNTDHFLEAARTILDALAPLHGVDPSPAWGGIETPLGACFTEPLSERARLGKIERSFRPVFDGIRFDYHKRAWEDAALSMQHPRDDSYGVAYALGTDRRWYDFHVAALAQRTFVQNQIP